MKGSNQLIDKIRFVKYAGYVVNRTSVIDLFISLSLISDRRNGLDDYCSCERALCPLTGLNLLRIHMAAAFTG